MLHGASLQSPESRTFERAMSRRWDIFLGALILMLGMAYFSSALLGGYLAQLHAATHYQPVSGFVDGADVVALPGPSRTRTNYAVRVQCRYTWAGRDYLTSADAYYGDRAVLDYREATDGAALYVPAEPITVYVNPAEPSSAVLDNREPRSVLPVVIMLALTGACGFLAVIGWRGWPITARDARR